MWGFILRLVGKASTGGIARTIVGSVLVAVLSLSFGVYKTYTTEKAIRESVELQINLEASEARRKELEDSIALLDSIAINKKDREVAWKREALQWKNKYKEMRSDPAIKEWADSNYPADLN